MPKYNTDVSRRFVPTSRVSRKPTEAAFCHPRSDLVTRPTSTYFGAIVDKSRDNGRHSRITIGHVKFLISLTYSFGAPLGYKRSARAAVAL